MKRFFNPKILPVRVGVLCLITAVGCLGVASGLSLASAPNIDRLPSSAWWRSKVQLQTHATHDRQFQGCLFGDSISSGLGNSLGATTFNFAMGGMSSVSMLEQLKMLYASNIRCERSIVAIGTNDAWYTISDAAFVRNLKRSIAILRSMGTTEIMVLPAFYSTVDASFDPSKAGSLERVEEINLLIQRVVNEENVATNTSELQPLFRNRSLKSNLTFDGVHLNASGKNIYRQALIKLFRIKDMAAQQNP